MKTYAIKIGDYYVSKEYNTLLHCLFRGIKARWLTLNPCEARLFTRLRLRIMYQNMRISYCDNHGLYYYLTDFDWTEIPDDIFQVIKVMRS